MSGSVLFFSNCQENNGTTDFLLRKGIRPLKRGTTKTESQECEVSRGRKERQETIADGGDKVLQGQKSDKDKGNGCFWSIRRSTNGEEEAEEEVMSESVK